MSSFKPALIKPTYDVANFGEDLSLPLNCLSGSTVTLTPSTATFVQVLEDSRVPIDEVSQFVSASDEMVMVHAGNDTDFDTSWEWTPDMSAQAYQISLNFAVGMKVSAYTSGNFKISDVQVVVGDNLSVNQVIIELEPAGQE